MRRRSEAEELGDEGYYEQSAKEQDDQDNCRGWVWACIKMYLQLLQAVVECILVVYKPII